MPSTTKPRIPELAQTLADAMRRLQPDEARLALAVYRQLAAGEPVPASALAAELDGNEAEIARTLESWPGVFRADDGRIVSFWGLAIPEMPHRFRVDGRQLHTWCAWDALFIPELIGLAAEVESRSPLHGEPVRLVVGPDRIAEVVPDATVLSLAEALDPRMIMSFCHSVHFFPSPEAGAEWVAEHPGTFLMTVAEAYELGRVVNAERFGAALASPRRAVQGFR